MHQQNNQNNTIIISMLHIRKAFIITDLTYIAHTRKKKFILWKTRAKLILFASIGWNNAGTEMKRWMLWHWFDWRDYMRNRLIYLFLWRFSYLKVTSAWTLTKSIHNFTIVQYVYILHREYYGLKLRQNIVFEYRPNRQATDGIFRSIQRLSSSFFLPFRSFLS